MTQIHQEEQELGETSGTGEEHHPLLGRATSAPEMGHSGKPQYGTVQGQGFYVRSFSNVFAWQRVSESRHFIVQPRSCARADPN